MSSKTFIPFDPPAPFLVVEPSPIIAADIVQSIDEYLGAGHAMAVHDVDAAKRALRHPGPRRAIFLRAETAQELEAVAAVEAQARRRGAEIIAMSGVLRPEAADARNLRLLPLPFTPEMIHRLLSGLPPV